MCLTAIYVCFTEKSKDKIRINEKAEELLSKVLKLISFVGDSLFSGDIPFSVLQDILKHKQEFIAMLCVSGKLCTFFP